VGPQERVRPAFYALPAGGWRDYVTLLHAPYTLWHLSYVALGAALAPDFHLDRLLWGVAAFFLALGVAAHALDELNGRPLQTHIPRRSLIGLAAASLLGALAIGVAAAVAWGYGLLAFVALGAVLVPAYNLEWFGGALHNTAGFALAWGAFPALTGYWVEAQSIGAWAVAGAVYATCLSVAQRRLSTPAREARRRRGDPSAAARHERALRLLASAAVAIALVAVAARLP
jgi:hypothetical protein